MKNDSSVHLSLTPPKCLTCSTNLSLSSNKVNELLQQGENLEEIFDQLNIRTSCCRSAFLSRFQFPKKVGPTKQSIQILEMQKKEKELEDEFKQILMKYQLKKSQIEDPEFDKFYNLSKQIFSLFISSDFIWFTETNRFVGLQNFEQKPFLPIFLQTKIEEYKNLVSQLSENPLDFENLYFRNLIENLRSLGYPISGNERISDVLSLYEKAKKQFSERQILAKNLHPEEFETYLYEKYKKDDNKFNSELRKLLRDIEKRKSFLSRHLNQILPGFSFENFFVRLELFEKGEISKNLSLMIQSLFNDFPQYEKFFKIPSFYSDLQRLFEIRNEYPTDKILNFSQLLHSIRENTGSSLDEIEEQIQKLRTSQNIVLPSKSSLTPGIPSSILI